MKVETKEINTKNKKYQGRVTIRSNGSKWYGQEPDGLEELLIVLKEYELDIYPFALLGFMRYLDNGNIRLFGNFRTLSHVFNIEGKEAYLGNVIEEIKQNIKRQSNKHVE